MEKGKKKAENVKTAKVVKPTEKKNMKATILGIAMIVAAIGLGVGTYAYYQTVITGEVSGTITSWNFVVNNEPASFVADLGNLKPGVSGQITLNLSSAGSGLGVSAVVSFSGKTNWPSNLKLYSDANKQSEIVIGTTQIARTLAANSSDTVVIYYDWPIGTAVEPQASTGTASFVITVVGTQVNPGA